MGGVEFTSFGIFAFRMSQNATIIGAGIGGLSAAIYLRRAGYEVTIYEKNPEPGGKLSRLVDEGCTFDLGPTVLTMPFVLEDLFRAGGARLKDYLRLLPVEPTCRYNWSDGTRFDAYSDREQLLEEVERLFPADSSALRDFLNDSARMYEATKDVFLFNPFRGLAELVSPRNARLLPLLREIGFTSTMSDSLRKRFSSEKLVQLFSRFATYNGSSPYSAPATLNVISHVEFGYGAWYPEGGMYKITESLVALARSNGVRIQTDAKVQGVEMDGKRARAVVVNGTSQPCDVVISNVDALWTYNQLLAPGGLRTPRSLTKAERSCSGFLILAVVEGEHSYLKHHNIFFGDNYPKEFDTIFTRKLLPEGMTIYVSISSKSDPTLAMPGRENWYILVNAPSGGPTFGDYAAYEAFADAVFARLRFFGVAPRVLKRSLMTPFDIEKRYNSLDGAIYGSSSNAMLSAFLRPPNKIKGADNIYLVGGSAHPGGGVPLVILSGKIVGEMVGRR